MGAIKRALLFVTIPVSTLNLSGYVLWTTPNMRDFTEIRKLHINPNIISKLMGNLSKADDMHDIDLSYHNYHEHNNSKLRVLRVMIGNRWAWAWFAHAQTTDIMSKEYICHWLQHGHWHYTLQ